MVIIPALIFAQFSHNTTSPYSRYGLGDLHSGNFGRSEAMGGAMIGSRNSYNINIANPASYSSVDTLSFLFEFGLKAKLTSFKTDISKMGANDINFDYFAFAFPITRRIGAGFGLIPYSDSGYDVQLTEEEETFGQVWHRYTGEGTLSRAYIGLGIQPIKNFSVGANVYYFFGTLTSNAKVIFLEGADYYTTQMYEQIRLRDFGLKLGLQATVPFSGKNSLTLGLTLENKPTFTGFHSLQAQKYLSYGTSDPDIDTIYNFDEIKDVIEMPMSLGAGLSFRTKDKLEVNADYIHESWSKALFFGATNPFLTDLDRYSFGIEFIPEKFSIRNYYQRIAYRAGFKFEESYLFINNHQINDVGISFGIGLPVFRSYSMVNFSTELGRRGTTTNNLVRENYLKMTLSINLYDQWFIKRKYD